MDMMPPSPSSMLIAIDDVDNVLEPLPKQLEAVKPATEFPAERHRWNTNEEVAAILVAFDQHAVWESQDVNIRPASGVMLLYNRKKARYRKDGYCWKKRRDGKTTREDHMKLKVQGIECIYGCYVHSAILPTFHRRCYWLLQNPDTVLVHYLNVPLTDNNRLCLPHIALQHVDCTHWSCESLVAQLRPMFASVRLMNVGNSMDDIVEDAVQSLVGHLLSPSSTLPLKRLAAPTVSTSLPATMSSIFSPKSAGSTQPQDSTAGLPASSNTHDQLIRIIRRPNAEPVSCPTVSSCPNPIQPVIYNLPMGNPGGLLIVRNPQPETVPVVTVPQPAMAHSWSQFLPRPAMGQPSSGAGNSRQPSSDNHSPPNSRNFLLESPHVSSKLPATPVYQQSSCDVKTELSLSSKPVLDDATFDMSRFTTGGASESSTVGEECDLPGGLSDSKSATLQCDVLEDLLHIVNASLGRVSDDQPDTDTHTLPDYDLTLDDDTSFISMVVSPDSEVPASTVEPLRDDTQLARIMDYCPEWSYVEGGMKVLVAGSWSETIGDYSVQFDSVTVPATLVQHGVLRCYAPAHSAGSVGLRVTCGDRIVSEYCQFEYKTHVRDNGADSMSLSDVELKKLLVQRLCLVQKNLEPTDNVDSVVSEDGALDSETEFVSCVRRLSERSWNCTSSSRMDLLAADLTLLHLAAALGMAQLIAALIKWRDDEHNIVLEQEVDALCVDHHGNTPLMWACTRGHKEAMLLLNEWNPLALLGLANLCSSFLLSSQRAVMSAGDDWTDSLTGSVASNCVHRDVDASSLSSSPPPYQCRDNDDVRPSQASTTVDLPFQPQPSHANTFPPTVSPTELLCLSDRDIDCRGEIEEQDRDESGDESELVDVEQSVTTSYTDDRPTSSHANKRTARLKKRTSVDVIPGFVRRRTSTPKISKTASVGDSVEIPAELSGSPDTWPMTVLPAGELRVSSSDSHLSGLAKLHSSSGGPDPMISMIDHDINSPPMMLSTDTGGEIPAGFPLDSHAATYILSCESMAVDIDSPSDATEVGGVADDSSDVSHSACDIEDVGPSNQMMTLASQIIAAMPERIKLSPSQSKQLLADEIQSRRNRAASYGSSLSSYSSACSSNVTPPTAAATSAGFNAEDSGVSTPLDGPSFLEYRYNADRSTPLSSALSPKSSSCVLSPYSFDIDSPPPTAEDFNEFFNAPATYMEKDFSQLTLSDEEQRRLYEAAKIIQSFYRRYKDKKEQQTRQQLKEIEAAILIQSYYRRYKQFMYYKRMTQAAVLIQSQFRSYYAQKRFRRSREAATIIQNRYRAYKEHERYKRSRSAAVIIQQRFRSHYQRVHGKQMSLANTVHKMMADRELKSDSGDMTECLAEHIEVAQQSFTESTTTAPVPADDDSCDVWTSPAS